jgi:hypothetical protein
MPACQRYPHHAVAIDIGAAHAEAGRWHMGWPLPLGESARP